MKNVMIMGMAVVSLALTGPAFSDVLLAPTVADASVDATDLNASNAGAGNLAGSWSYTDSNTSSANRQFVANTEGTDFGLLFEQGGTGVNQRYDALKYSFDTAVGFANSALTFDFDLTYARSANNKILRVNVWNGSGVSAAYLDWTLGGTFSLVANASSTVATGVTGFASATSAYDPDLMTHMQIVFSGTEVTFHLTDHAGNVYTKTVPVLNGSTDAGAISFVTVGNTTAAQGFWLDNVTVVAEPLPEPVVWFDATEGVGEDNGVEVWTNLASPGTLDAVQAEGSKRPELDYESWPGHLLVHFDGVDDLLTLENSATNSSLQGELTVFVVGRVTGGDLAAGSGGFIGNYQTGTSGANGWALRAEADGTYGALLGNGGANGVSGGSAGVEDDFVMLNSRYADDGDGTGTLELYSSLLDEPASTDTTPFAMVPGTADLSIGMFSSPDSLGFDAAVECDIAEIRIYDSALSDANRQTVWNELSAKYDIAVVQPGSVILQDFQPEEGAEVAADTPIVITFVNSIDPDSIDNVIVGIGGLDGYPQGGSWVRASGQWTAAQGNRQFTFVPDEPFAPGDLVMCEITDKVVSTEGDQYTTSSRETFSFIIDNGVNYPVAKHTIDPMATVYHDNGDAHILPMTLDVPATAEPCPVMFWVHGGGWNGGGGGSWEKSATGSGMMSYYFANKLGVAVVGVAWRGQSTSQGTFTKMKEDIGLAIQYVVDHADEYHLDVTRMGLYGGSAGTPASALLSQENTGITCYIGFNGLYDFVNRTSPYGFGGGSAFDQNVPSYTANSAALNIRSNPPDTLLMHGSKDTTIEKEQSLNYETALVAAGGTAEALIYTDEVHAFFNPGRPMHLPTLVASAKHLSRVFKLGYSNWAHRHKLTGAAGDDDDGDMRSNLCEYALGGDPANPADTGVDPAIELSGAVVKYRYPRRISADSALVYAVERSDDLAAGSWSQSGIVEVGSEGIDDAFESVITEIPTLGKPKGFIRLNIQEE
ncbi:MAG: alpha/beta hydrolase family protein [Verrucomicrobiota bacterium JB025]|nr:prolyl oligopeptidase family serine peptidase [Verrucomicrobiota bacterium JB025]